MIVVRAAIFVFIILAAAVHVVCWTPHTVNSQELRRSHNLHSKHSLALHLSSNGLPEEDEEEEEEVDIGSMRVSEIKAELKLRGIDFSDCFDRESLAQKLRMVRTRGKADPSIVDRFNRQRVSALANSPLQTCLL